MMTRYSGAAALAADPSVAARLLQSEDLAASARQGAVVVKSTVYDEENFEWLLKEIVDGSLPLR